ncbi:5-methylcytosine-specific restriction endonuclease system specificity protein McrC [Thermobrachium celere]|uniref:5-methylcytosine-specific restriction endonuclease system specificity protein McrC n=1 Tax=Thermobrachium celere TaxID=53422 RepID=UPI001943B32F|nr:5-methylcytosine-specific restriction endonuclease system specificity protein McrC [Thermobrachium celere]GFR36680.1 5-methylcytosine-specific restriction system specificity protein McrC [Thermobrachium celere]
METYYDKIPIKNIYYMLCYAWDILDEKDEVLVNQLEYLDIYNLLAHVYVEKVQRLIKKGFYRQYRPLKEESSIIKGKIDFSESIRRFTINKAKMYCDFEELNHDILFNQIIKATLILLTKYKKLDKKLKDKILFLLNYFNNIGTIKLNEMCFKNLKLNRNNIYYRVIMNISYLIFKNCLINEKKGTYKFINFQRNHRKMASLFENFVRNFYKRECPQYSVYRENIKWVAEGDNFNMLPLMQTDISIEKHDRKIIIDTKYYYNAFTNYMGNEKIITNNLYQLFAYLKNDEFYSRKQKPTSGILLYPQVTKSLNLKYNIHGHEVKICTVNLNSDWKNIHKRLIEIVED